ncbi:MAG: phosphatidate cytidylyltransferase [Acidimicrobiales bacterium]
MADNKRRGLFGKGSEESSTPSIFDLFEPPPEQDSSSITKIPIIRDGDEIDLSELGVTEARRSAEAEAAGLQHWTEPASGQVPAALAEPTSSAPETIRGPSWQGEEPNWMGPDLSDVFADSGVAATERLRRRPPRPGVAEPEPTRQQRAISVPSPVPPVSDQGAQPGIPDPGGSPEPDGFRSEAASAPGIPAPREHEAAPPPPLSVVDLTRTAEAPAAPGSAGSRRSILAEEGAAPPPPPPPAEPTYQAPTAFTGASDAVDRVGEAAPQEAHADHRLGGHREAAPSEPFGDEPSPSTIQPPSPADERPRSLDDDFVPDPPPPSLSSTPPSERPMSIFDRMAHEDPSGQGEEGHEMSPPPAPAVEQWPDSGVGAVTSRFPAPADGPVTDAPTYDGPTYDSPTHDGPTHDSRTYDSRTYDSRTYDSPTYDSSALEGPGQSPPAPAADEPPAGGGGREASPHWEDAQREALARPASSAPPPPPGPAPGRSPARHVDGPAPLAGQYAAEADQYRPDEEYDRRPRPEDRPEFDDGLDDDGGRDFVQSVLVGLGMAVVVFTTLFFGPVPTMVMVGLLTLLAVMEVFNGMREARLRPATLLGLVGAVALPLASYVRGESAYPLVIGLSVVFGMLWYLTGADTERPVLNLGLTFTGILWIGGLAAFAALMIRHEGDTDLLAATIIITAASDSLAYIGGRAYGNRPFHPASPGKTWEGTMTGFFGALFAGLAIGVTDLFSVFDGRLVAVLVLAAVVGILAPIGDLAESMVKRDLGIKDMGSLIPSHGGVMDRVDGLLFALPGAFYVALIYQLF